MSDRPRMQLMMPGAIRDAFRNRGWVSRAGGELYYNGIGSSEHPHLHMRIASISTGERPRVGGDIRLAITMLAYSNGQPGQGRTFIRDGGDTVASNWRVLAQQCPMGPAVRDEFAWIIDYFTSG